MVFYRGASSRKYSKRFVVFLLFFLKKSSFDITSLFLVSVKRHPFQLTIRILYWSFRKITKGRDIIHTYLGKYTTPTVFGLISKLHLLCISINVKFNFRCTAVTFDNNERKYYIFRYPNCNIFSACYIQ